MTHNTWDVVMEPVGENGRDKKNTSGIGIFLTVNGTKHEVCRVAFVRRYAEAKPNRVKPFKRQLKEELEKAYTAKDTMNTLNADVTELRRQLDAAEQAAQEKIAVLLKQAEERRTNTLARLEQNGGLV